MNDSFNLHTPEFISKMSVSERQNFAIHVSYVLLVLSVLCLSNMTTQYATLNIFCAVMISNMQYLTISPKIIWSIRFSFFLVSLFLIRRRGSAC